MSSCDCLLFRHPGRSAGVHRAIGVGQSVMLQRLMSGPRNKSGVTGGGGEGGGETLRPDFRIKRVLITPMRRSCGGKFIVWVNVENQGTANGNAGCVSLRVDGKLFGAVKVGALDKKKTKVVKFTNVKSTKGYSPIVLTLKVDCYNVTRETNESNNTTTKNVLCK